MNIGTYNASISDYNFYKFLPYLCFVIIIIVLGQYGWELYLQSQHLKQQHRRLQRERLRLEERVSNLENRVWHLQNDASEIEREIRNQLFYIGRHERILIEEDHGSRRRFRTTRPRGD